MNDGDSNRVKLYLVEEAASFCCDTNWNDLEVADNPEAGWKKAEDKGRLAFCKTSLLHILMEN